MLLQGKNTSSINDHDAIHAFMTKLRHRRLQKGGIISQTKYCPCEKPNWTGGWIEINVKFTSDFWNKHTNAISPIWVTLNLKNGRWHKNYFVSRRTFFQTICRRNSWRWSVSIPLQRTISKQCHELISERNMCTYMSMGSVAIYSLPPFAST